MAHRHNFANAVDGDEVTQGGISSFHSSLLISFLRFLLFPSLSFLSFCSLCFLSSVILLLAVSIGIFFFFLVVSSSFLPFYLISFHFPLFLLMSVSCPFPSSCFYQPSFIPFQFYRSLLSIFHSLLTSFPLTSLSNFLASFLFLGPFLILSLLIHL